MNRSTRPPTAEEARRYAEATRGKTADIFDNIQWAAQNVRLRWTIIDPDSCPCSAAVSMLKLAKANPTEFYTKIFSRLLEQELSLQDIRERRIRTANRNRNNGN